MTKKIGLATSADLSTLMPDERLLAVHLRHRGCDAVPLVWDDPSHDTKDLAAIVIRTCWDYHKKPQQFLEWICKLESEGRTVWNAPEILRWNVDKKYLRDLEACGARIPHTVWIEKGERRVLSEILGENGWHQAILKPSISATAWRTFLVTSQNSVALQTELEKILSSTGAMIQIFVEEIQAKGEWSFVFFNKEFSHAVLKRAKKGDFRVQNDFGGRVESMKTPSPELVRDAKNIVESVSEDLLYARVDGVEIGGKLYLMELELIEPHLFLINDFIAGRFAESILAKLANGHYERHDCA